MDETCRHEVGFMVSAQAMEDPVPSPSRDRWGLAAILLPVVALGTLFLLPYLLHPQPQGVAKFIPIAVIFALLLSVPFGACVALSGWKKDRRRMMRGIAGFVTGVVSCALVVVGLMVVTKKTRAIQAEFERRSTDSPAGSVPPVPD